MEFAYLQVLDVLTTIAFLTQGVSEANPVIRWVIREGPSPLPSLLLIKLFGVSLALFCVYHSRHSLLRRVNLFFAALVAYNLVALIIATMQVG